MWMPVADLMSNWAYMVVAALAWNLKACSGLLVPNRGRGAGVSEDGVPALLERDHSVVRQVVRTARRVNYRLLA